MSSIFISHSSKDNWFAELLKNQLEAHGHQSIFLDFDPENGIPAGSNWEQVLYAKLRSSQAVIVLCSPNSMTSNWVFAEITHSRSEGKIIFPLQIAECELFSILKDTQIIDCISEPGAEPNLDRLWQGIKVANLDSEFAWNPERDPYPGLTAFDEEDAAIFFGRKKEIQESIEQLKKLRQNSDRRFILYLGASGSGKSSLVKAGIIPRLKRDPERWLVVDPFRPNEGLADPMDNLVTVLQKAFADQNKETTISEVEIKKDLLNTDDGQAHGLLKLARKLAIAKDKREATVLIVIDQFEEFLISNSLANDNEEKLRQARKPQRDFLAWIKEALVASQKLPSCPIMLVATMRSDFLTEYQRCEELRDVSTRQISVMPIAKANFGELIEAPAQRAGIELEAGLVPKILEDIGTDNALPLLAYTLYELWERYGDDYKLELSEYEKLGGIKGSIAKKANEVISGEDINQQEIEDYLKRAFLKLVRVNDAGVYVRLRAKESDLPSEALPFLDKLVKNRLLYKDNESDDSKTTIYEVTHEAIFSAWDKLASWLKENQEFLIWCRRFDESYKAYIESDKDYNSLLGGTPLSQALDWQNQLGEKEIGEKEFIRLSERKQKRRQRRFLGLAIGFGISGIAAIFFSFVFFLSAQESRLKASAANTKAKLTVSNQVEQLLESIQLVGANLDYNQRLIWKTKTELIPEVQSVLYQAVSGVRQEYNFKGYRVFFKSEDFGNYPLDFIDDSNYFIGLGLEGKGKLLDEENKDLIHSVLGAHKNYVSFFAISNNGNFIVSCDYVGKVNLWDVKNKKLIHSFNVTDNNVYSVAISNNGNLIVYGGSEGSVNLWSVKNKKLIHSFKGTKDKGHKDEVYAVAISNDGNYIASGGGIRHEFSNLDFSVKLWDVKNKKLIHSFDGHDDGVSSVAISNGDYIVSGSGQVGEYSLGDWSVKLWDVKNEKLIHSFDDLEIPINSVAISNESDYILGLSDINSQGKLWFVKNEELIQSFDDSSNPIKSITVNKNDLNIVYGFRNGSMKLFDTKRKSLIQLLKSSLGSKGLLTINESDNFIVSRDYSNLDGYSYSISLRNAKNRSIISSFLDRDNVGEPVTISNNSNFIITASAQERNDSGDIISWTLKLWDAKNKKLIYTFDNLEAEISSLAVSNDGKYFAYDKGDGILNLWNVKSKSLIHPFVGHENRISSVTFGNDGNYIVSGDRSTLKLWDVKNKLLVHTFKGHASYVDSVVVSKQGNYIFNINSDKTINTWLGTNWQNWLARGCERIKMHPLLFSSETDFATKVAKTCIEYGEWTEQVEAEFLVKQGLALAEDSYANKAKNKFKKAYKLDIKNVDLEALDAETNKLAAQTLKEQGLNLATNLKIREAKKKFRQAVKLVPDNFDLEALNAEASKIMIRDGVIRARDGNVSEALNLYDQAKKLETKLEIDAGSWNLLCWYGSFYEQAKEVLLACEKAVTLAPNQDSKANSQDSRGLARALTAKSPKEIQAAIDDFDFFIKYSSTSQESKNKRKQWIDSLNKGNKPFSRDVLEKLKYEKEFYN